VAKLVCGQDSSNGPADAVLLAIRMNVDDAESRKLAVLQSAHRPILKGRRVQHGIICRVIGDFELT